MNAPELADKLEQKGLTADAMEYGFEVDFEEAATMLRQQQAEIEALRSELDRAVELYTDKAIENEALKELLANEGIVVGHDYLNNCIATMRKAQVK